MTRTLSTPKDPIAIRPAVPDDAAPLRELRLQALADSPTAFSMDYNMAAAETPEQWAARISAYAAQDTGLICVAASGGELVGMTGFYRESRPKTRHGGTIWGVYVSPHWRGFQVAEALIGECLAWGQTHGVVVARLGVSAANIPAIRCYARCGFTVYGLETKSIFYGGAYYDELLMTKPIG